VRKPLSAAYFRRIEAVEYAIRQVCNSNDIDIIMIIIMITTTMIIKMYCQAAGYAIRQVYLLLLLRLLRLLLLSLP
jgi:hypothetical protein